MLNVPHVQAPANPGPDACTLDHTPYDGPTAEDWADYHQWLADREAMELDAWMAAMEAEAAGRDAEDPWQSWNDDEIRQARA